MVIKSTKSYIDGYLFTSNTVFMTVKQNSSKAYKADVEVVDFDNLETSTGTVDYVVADINDNNEVKLVVLYDGFKRVSEDSRFAFVLSKEDLDKDEEFDYAFEVIYNDGEVATYYSNDDDIVEPGNMYELTLNGKEITDKTTTVDGVSSAIHPEAGTNTIYVTDLDNDGIIEYIDLVATTKESAAAKNISKYVLAENYVFVKENKDELYWAKSILFP